MAIKRQHTKLKRMVKMRIRPVRPSAYTRKSRKGRRYEVKAQQMNPYIDSAEYDKLIEDASNLVDKLDEFGHEIKQRFQPFLDGAIEDTQYDAENWLKQTETSLNHAAGNLEQLITTFTEEVQWEKGE